MSRIETLYTATWSVGAIYRAARRWNGLKEGWLGLVLWLLSSSWIYDLYLWLRDGIYPATWLANLAASSLLYLSAGLLWNLEWRQGRGVTLAFLEAEWFRPGVSREFARIQWYAHAFMALGAAMLVPYLFQ